ncbi:MAG: hypothetical protein SF053_04550 [Bacteroidia bacterium]|nr:hypothetical protein [Bacteroidia bacterium]
MKNLFFCCYTVLTISLLLLGSHRLAAQAWVNDPSFRPNDTRRINGTNAPVTAMAVQADSGVILAGVFTEYLDQAVPYGIVRLYPDGTRDPSFQPPGLSTYDIIYCLTIQSDGKILVGGYFRNLRGVFRLNPNGSLDTTFNPGTGINRFGIVRCITVRPDGMIYLGGEFEEFDGLSYQSIARLHEDGSLDLSFDPGIGFSSGAVVTSIMLQPDGLIVVGGEFSSYNGQARANIVRILPTGSLDVFFSPGLGANARVQALAQYPDGRIMVGGNFTVFNQYSRNGMVRLLPDGSVDALFTSFYSPDSWKIKNLAVLPDGRVIAAGYISWITGVNLGVCHFRSDGVPDSTFYSYASVTESWATISCLQLLPDGKFFVAGDFKSYNGWYRVGVLKLNADNTLDMTFNQDLSITGGSITDMVLQPDGKILIAGNFQAVDDVLYYGVARLYPDGNLDTTFVASVYLKKNGTAPARIALQPNGGIVVVGDFTSTNTGLSSTKKIFRLHPDGSLDLSYNPTLQAAAYNRLSCQAILAMPDNSVLVGGRYISSPNQPAAFLKINPLGGYVPGFYHNGGYSSPYLLGENIQVLAGQQDGKILVGTQYNMYRFNPDGTLDNTFVSGGLSNSEISCMVLEPDNNILVGVKSRYLNESTLRRVNSTGMLDPGFSVSLGGTLGFAYVKTVQITPDHKILIAGNFESVNGVSRKGIARLHQNGALDLSFDPGEGFGHVFDSNSSPAAQALLIVPNDKIIVAGDFSLFRGQVRHQITRLMEGDPATDITDPGSGQASSLHTITLAPNPSSGRFMLRSARPLVQASARLLTLTGQEVSTRTGLSGTEWTLDYPGLPAGIYLLEVREADRAEWVRVVIE